MGGRSRAGEAAYLRVSAVVPKKGAKIEGISGILAIRFNPARGGMSAPSRESS
jgi:hypothetical protein